MEKKENGLECCVGTMAHITDLRISRAVCWHKTEAQTLRKCKGRQSEWDSEQEMMQHSYAYTSVPRTGTTV